jgi:hypothetical protein
LKLQASAAQLEEQQQQSQQALKDSLPSVELPTDHSGPMRPDRFNEDLDLAAGGEQTSSVTVQQVSSIEARVNNSAAGGESSTSKPTPIEDLLLKATISSLSTSAAAAATTRKGSITTSGGGAGLSLSSSSSSAPSASPPAPGPSITTSSPIMNMLLKPKSVTGRGASPVGVTLLNPSGLKGQSGGTSSSTIDSSSNGGEGVTLDRNQLKATLLRLIEDDAFVDMLHDRYLSTIKGREVRG